MKEAWTYKNCVRKAKAPSELRLDEKNARDNKASVCGLFRTCSWQGYTAFALGWWSKSRHDQEEEQGCVKGQGLGRGISSPKGVEHRSVREYRGELKSSEIQGKEQRQVAWW